jgi:hypothetical protein
MMDARKLLINLLYRASAQSSEMSGWGHRQTKKSRHQQMLERLFYNTMRFTQRQF